METEKIKNPVGHPRKYKSKEDLNKKIDEYFSQCKPEYLLDDDGIQVLTDKGVPIRININAPSLSGLALYLGFASRQSIYDNEKLEEFSYIYKKARTKVEEWIYQHSLDGSVPPAVGIFILKQFGYTDRQTIDYTNVGNPMLDALNELTGRNNPSAES